MSPSIGTRAEAERLPSAIERARTRGRAVYALAILPTIAAGLASRRWPALLPDALGKYPGDALYAVMIYWLVALACPRSGLVRSGAWALALCFVIEGLQLWQPTWLQTIRATTLGHLVLGSHFHAADLLAYTIGVLAAMGLEALLVAITTTAGSTRGED